MTNVSTSTPASTPIAWEWMLLALGSHTAWGIYPVVVRYLQNRSHLPGMAILTLANLIVLVLIGAVVVRRSELATLRAPVLWGVAVLAMLRSVTNVLSARYAPAVYVQLTNLLTPFFVVGIGATIFRERIPPRTGVALALSLVGALAMLSGDFDFKSGLRLALSGSEWIGIAFALVSAVVLALYMLAVRHTHSRPVSGEATFAVQLIVLILTSAVLSAVFGEDWSSWQRANSFDWFLFFFFAIVVVLGANLTQINALRRLGAPLVSSMQAWRLIAALVTGGLLLGEWLTTPTQIFGIVLVLLTVSWYLWRQRPA
jgi:drug/metabolite transporter (DMT)-like permease